MQKHSVMQPTDHVIADKFILVNVGSRRLRGPFTLKLHELTPEENVQWEKKLNRLRSDCGCSMGSLFVLVGLTLYAVFLYLVWAKAVHHIWITVGAGVFILLSFAGGGKAIGILRARRKFSEAVGCLAALLDRRISERTEDNALREMERRDNPEMFAVPRPRLR